MTTFFGNDDEGHTRITKYTLATCLGLGRHTHLEAIRAGRSGLAPSTNLGLPFDCYIGRVPAIGDMVFPERVSEFDNRANRLALAALETDGFVAETAAVRERWGADRCGVVIGTTTSGLEKLESAYRERRDGSPLPDYYQMRHHDDHQAVAAFVKKYLGLTGPSYTISTACTSSAKALVDACQLIDADFCDAVIVGGVDSLCLTTLNGFEALHLISRLPCRPCDAARNGLSIGEGAAFIVVERDAEHGARLRGVGESSDGVSMSTPPEDGAGAVMAMRAALNSAEVDPMQVGYVNLHGTATPANDTIECTAIKKVFGSATPSSSLKGMIGHTLGAAGAVEAVMTMIALEENLIPGNVGLDSLDPDITCNIVSQCRSATLTHAVSNSFGFGGSNCVLLLGP